MWLIGLIIGAIIGAIGGGAGAFFGAVAGAGLGWAMAKKWDGDDRFARLESSIAFLQERVATLERAQPKAAFDQSPPHSEPSPSAPPVVAAETIQSDRAAARVEPVAAEPLGPAPETGGERAMPEPVATIEPIASRLEPQPDPVLRRPVPPAPSALWNFFFGGNALVRFGVVVLFFGVAFLLKYASEHIEISIEARLVGVALGAMVMLAIGWRLRGSRPGYALIVQGGGIGVLYLTVFAAYRLYHLLPAGLVFALLAAMAIFSAMLAVMQDSRSLAAFGVAGGFLAPILASTGAGSHVALFSFYALLNLGIVIIAWFKAWRPLNLLGFAFTFIIGLVWGARYYRAEYFTSTEPFLILFFLFYVVIAVLFTLRQDANIKNPLDGTLVFGAPLVGFGLQTALVRDIEYATAFSALVLGGFYLVLAKVLFARASEYIRLLVESFLALGVVFGTLAIPLALDGRWTAAAWALEGAAILWVGVRQNKMLAQGFGIFLQFAAGIAFLSENSAPSGLAIFNSRYLGSAMIAVAALFCAWYVRHQKPQTIFAEGVAVSALLLWGNGWWFGGGLVEIHRQVEPIHRLHAAVLFFTASCALFSLLHRGIDWRDARLSALALVPLMVLCAVIEADLSAHPSMHFGFVVWPIAFVIAIWLLRRHDDTNWIGVLHTAGLWLFTALGSWEIAWWVGELVRGGDVWRFVGWPLLSIALVAWLSDGGERRGWPVARHFESYLFHGAIALAGFLWLWMLHANFESRGDPAPLPYLPLFNPLDIAQGAALLTLFGWLRRLRAVTFAPEIFRTTELASVALGTIAFIWLNGLLLRTLHHWAAVPLNLDAMVRSMLVQASLSIFWSVLALCSMVAATRLRVRPLWLTGAGLMAIVVAKLFFIDLSNISGIERIVSFIGVGLLMLVIGYLSPVPPAQSEAK